MNKTRMAAATLKFARAYVVVSVMAAVLLLLNVWPWHPASIIGWILFFALALPVTAVGEWLGIVLLENRFAASLGRDTSANSVSWLRIGYGVVASLVLLAVFGMVFSALVSWWRW